MKPLHSTLEARFHRLGLFVSALLLSGTMLAAGARGQDKTAPPQKDPLKDLPHMTMNQSIYEVAPSLRPAWEDLWRINISRTLTGPAVFGIAQSENIRFFSLPLPVPVLGYHINGEKIILVTSDTLWRIGGERIPLSRDEKLCTLVHELTHANQEKNGLTRLQYIDSTYSLRDNQKMVLCREAAAVTAAYLVAFEMMKKEDDIGPWQSCWDRDKTAAMVLSATFDAGLRTGLSYQAALERAGAACFQQVFKQQWWLDSYNETTLSSFVDLLRQGRLQDISGAYTVGDARKTGALGETFNFTAGLDSLPSRHGIFGNNKNMACLFDYAEYLRAVALFGAEDVRARGLQQLMQLVNNVYADIPADHVLDEIKNSPTPDLEVALYKVAAHIGGKRLSRPAPVPLHPGRQ